MNVATLDSKLAQGPTPCASRISARGAELLVFLAMIIGCNLHLFAGGFPEATVFLPERVAAGEWWRLVTHAFAHLSWYHLALDGAGFLILYRSLPIPTRAGRLLIVASSVAGSLASAAFMDARVA